MTAGMLFAVACSPDSEPSNGTDSIQRVLDGTVTPRNDIGNFGDAETSPTVNDAVDISESIDTEPPPGPDTMATDTLVPTDIVTSDTETVVPTDTNETTDTSQTGMETVSDVSDSDGGNTDIPILPKPTFDPNAFAEDVVSFPLSVMAADVTADGAILWARYDGNEPLRLIIYDLENLEIALDIAVDTSTSFLKTEVVGLLPWHNYGYAFVHSPDAGEGSFRSVTGRFRTAPDADSMPAVVFGATSCIKVGLYEPKSLARAAEDTLDFFIMAGDTVYADGAETLWEYESMWAETYAVDHLMSLHPSTSFIHTWDDHEVENNWNPESIAPLQLVAAKEAYFNHAPQRENPSAPEQLWRSFVFGRTMEIFVLDSRGERKPSTKDTAGAQYLSPEQMDWLKAGLLSSQAVFKVIVNSVAFTNMPFFYISEEDRWEGYASQREELFDTLDEVDGVLFVAGDFHFGAIMKIEPPEHPLGHIPEILAGPAAQFPNPANVLLQSIF